MLLRADPHLHSPCRAEVTDVTDVTNVTDVTTRLVKQKVLLPARDVAGKTAALLQGTSKMATESLVEVRRFAFATYLRCDRQVTAR